MNSSLLVMQHITKIYDNGVMANNDINLSIAKGEIHALVGENGAGKSTLMKVLFGEEKSDRGTIYFDGKDITGYNSRETIELGIGMVHQHFMLVDSLKVFENVVLGMEPNKWGTIDDKAAIQLVKNVSQKYNLKVDPLAKVGDLSVGVKQKVEIIKTLARGAKLLILDEPTAVLTPQETEELFDQLLLLKEAGYTVIFISHKIREVRRICSRITVLRAGKTIGTMEVAGSTEEEISQYMVGRDVILKVHKSNSKFGPPVLTVKNLNYSNQDNHNAVKDVSFSVRRGQILGIAGVEGNGQQELAECIFGMVRAQSGTIDFNGKHLEHKKIREVRALGMSYVPEDRLKTGLSVDLNVWQNLVADRIDSPQVQHKKLLNQKKIDDFSNKLIQDFNIICQDKDQAVGFLSGGNMQKIVVAREISSEPDLLIASQPTRGIDIGANEFIWKKLVELRDKNKGVILISADLNEIMELSDSILVMHAGRVAAYFEDASQVDEYNLGLYMLGLKTQNTLEENAHEN